MPHYDYVCAACGHQEEILQKMQEVALTHCPQCRQPDFQRKIGAGIGLQFQGSGFYITDYGQSSAGQRESTSTASNACGCKQTACSAK